MVTVFITADLDERVSNICKRHNCSEEEARKLISDKESTRSSYYNYYTGKTWGDSASYDSASMRRASDPKARRSS